MSIKHIGQHYQCGCIKLLPAPPGLDAIEPRGHCGQPFILSSHWIPRQRGFEVGGGRVDAMPGRESLPQRCHKANLPGHNEATANVDILLAYRMQQYTLWPAWHAMQNTGCILFHSWWYSCINSVRWLVHLMKRLPFESTVTWRR